MLQRDLKSQCWWQTHSDQTRVSKVYLGTPATWQWWSVPGSAILQTLEASIALEKDKPPSPEMHQAPGNRAGALMGLVWCPTWRSTDLLLTGAVVTYSSWGLQNRTLAVLSLPCVLKAVLPMFKLPETNCSVIQYAQRTFSYLGKDIL